MHIYCLGLNHTTADVNLREALALNEESVKASLARLGCGYGAVSQTISEMVILSTCNRVELYAVSFERGFRALENFLAETCNLPQERFADHLYRLVDLQTVNHLLRVAAGLDSLVLGEPQILGQVMQALELARGQNAVGPVLSRLFQVALHAGKRVRTETSIGHNPASISSVAVHLAALSTPDLASAQVMVLGAGEMAELAVEALRKRGVSRILVVNRTLERASRLAMRWGGEAAAFEYLTDGLIKADIVITSTGAPHTIISKEMVAEAQRQRAQRHLTLLDIALPRDVEPQVADLPDVSLYDLDGLQERLDNNLSRRALEVPQAERIIEQVQTEFEQYLSMLDVFPLIAAMHQRAEAIRRSELEKTLRHLPELNQAERQRLDALTQSLINKILHAPITRLRTAAGSPQAAETAAAARDLFDLGPSSSDYRGDYRGIFQPGND